MHDLKIGMRVRTPHGEGVIVGMSPPGRVYVGAPGQVALGWERDVLEPMAPLPPDIPRERVEDLLASVEKRIGGYIYAGSLARRELSEVAEALRLLLGGES